MRSLKKMCICGIAGVAICAGMMSCNSVDKQNAATPEFGRDASREQRDMQKTALSKERIIDIANAVARQAGWNLDQAKIIYDEGNVYWRQVARGPWTQLDGHDFQAVVYWHKQPIPEGGFWVLVDRNSGEVLSAKAAP